MQIYVLCARIYSQTKDVGQRYTCRISCVEECSAQLRRYPYACVSGLTVSRTSVDGYTYVEVLTRPGKGEEERSNGWFGVASAGKYVHSYIYNGVTESRVASNPQTLNCYGGTHKKK